MNNPLEEVWSALPKSTENGRDYVYYRALEVPYLYLLRMADPNKCSIQEWMDAFEDSRLSDGVYRLSHEQFLAKSKYYNTKIPTNPPFDPKTLRMGAWEEKELDRIYFERIREETILADNDWVAIKDKIRQSDGRLLVSEQFVRELGIVLEKYPSIIRQRAIHIQKQKEETKQTSFSAGETGEKAAQKKLKNLLVKR